MSDARTKTHQDPVAIVGMGCLFPGSRSLEDFWDNICAGVDALSEVPPGRWDPVHRSAGPSGPAGADDSSSCRRGGFVDDLAEVDPMAFGIMPVAMAGGEPDQFLALAQAAAALADCGDPHDRTPSDRVGVIVGRGGYQTPGLARLTQRVATAPQVVEALRALLPGIDEARLEQVREEFLAQLGPDHPETAIGLVPNLVASRIANRLDLQGPAYTVDAACASALVALDHATMELASRRCDLVLAGGVHHCHDVTLWSVFTQLGALSGTGQIRPFSQRADGTVIGEGSGFVALKRLADAERDGDRIYAVVRGTGVASDGRGRSLMSPDTAGQVLAMERAWAAAGLDPATIGLLEAHGAGTPVGDEVELESLRQVFGKADDDAPRAGLGSVKSMIGHAMPAAGAAGLIKASLAVHHGVWPPTLHAGEPHPLVADTRFRLVGETEPWPGPGDAAPVPRRAAVSAFGFGGINAHVVLEQHTGSPPRRRRPPRAGDSLAADAHAGAQTLFIAGDNARDVARQLRDMAAADSREPASPAVPPDGGSARLAIIGASARRLELARRVVEQGQPWRGRDNVWFEPKGLLAAGGKLALLFPGVEPAFEPRVDDVARQFGLEHLVEDLEDAGRPASATPARDDSAALYRQARGIIAVGRLLHWALSTLGVEADMVAGHSIGEWTGELATGVLAEVDFDALVTQLAPGSVRVADLGFLATGCGVERARELAEGLESTTVSHDNCPHQTVLCGPPDELATVAKRCRERRILAQELPFRSGFHSPLLSEHLPAIGRTLGALPMRPPAIPLWSATTCQPYPDDPAAIRNLATRHLIEPVRFRELLLAMHAAGARVFVQMGPGGLCGFVDDTLRRHDAVALAANKPRHSGLEQLYTVATALWVEGRDVAFDRLASADSGPTPPEGSATRQSEGRQVHPVKLDLGTRLVRKLTPLEPLQEHLSGPQSAPSSLPQATPRLTRERIFALVDEPAWADHALFRQAEGWPHPGDRFPVVPMTGIVEVLVAAAQELVPGLVPVAVEDVAAFRWLAVEPPTRATIRAACETDESDHTTVRVKAAIDGHARATVVMAPSYPAAPTAPRAPLVDERLSPLSAREFYRDRHMFHGPAYQGVTELVSVAGNGSRARLAALSAPGALLDAAGQLMGHWLAAGKSSDAAGGPGRGKLVLPTAIERIDLHGPFPPTGTEVDCTLVVTGEDERTVTCDLTLSLGGRVWAQVTGWQDRCFPTDEAMFQTFQWPERCAMSKPLAPDVALIRERWSDSATRDLVMRRYLGQDERAHYERRNPNAQRQLLLERIAVKDAVRTWLWSQRKGDADRVAIFPAEVLVSEDDRGKPLVQRQGALRQQLKVGVDQVDDLAVAVARAADALGDTCPGIDIERIEPRRPTFEEVALTPGERDLSPPEDFDRDTWLTCLWAIKEAAARTDGRSLQGRPQDIAVREHANGIAVVGDSERTHRIAFTRVGPESSARSPKQKEYIVAWSIAD